MSRETAFPVQVPGTFIIRQAFTLHKHKQSDIYFVTPGHGGNGGECSYLGGLSLPDSVRYTTKASTMYAAAVLSPTNNDSTQTAPP